MFLIQIGLIQLLYTKFRVTLILCIIYMVLSISLHTWDIKIHWSSPLKYYWTKDFHVFYSLHRAGNIFSIKFYVHDIFIIFIFSCSFTLLSL